MVETMRIDREPEQQYDVIPAEMSLLEAAEKVARGELKLSPQQTRVLIELLPYHAPKQSAVTHIDARDFAVRLDKAIERSERGKVIKLIEHRPNEGNGNGQ